MMPRRVIDVVGGFDESLWLFYNDVDLCRRIHGSGQKIRYIAEEKMIHHEGASTKKFRAFILEWNINRLRYYRKHYGASGSLLIYGVTWLRAQEERLRILFRHKGDERRASLAGVSEVLNEMKRERALVVPK